jgi:hypothetical protein
MGQVHKARDTRVDRLVAIKPSAAEFGDRFERKARRSTTRTSASCTTSGCSKGFR